MIFFGITHVSLHEESFRVTCHIGSASLEICFFLKQPTITTKNKGRYIKGCMPHGSSWIVFCKCHNQIHVTKICSLFSTPLDATWTHGNFFPCSQYQPYASKQAIFFRMSQGRRINVLKLGMNNPNDHDFPYFEH